MNRVKIDFLKDQIVESRNFVNRLISELPEDLWYDAVHEICVEGLSKLDDGVLHEVLEPIPFRHPVANTKYESLSWCFKHEMWHSAEMEALKQAFGHPVVWMK